MPRDAEGLFIELDLGLHAAQKGGPHADFALVLFGARSDWGMRAALRKYYELFPGLFTKRVPPEREGSWFVGLNTKTIGDASDFNLAFDERSGTPGSPGDRWAWGAERNIYTMEYSEPWAYRDQHHPRGSYPYPTPPYEQKISHLEAGLSSGVAKTSDGSRAALQSGMVGIDGKMVTNMSWWQFHDRWHVMYPTILHPDLANGMQDWMMKHEYQRWLDDSIAQGAPLKGWYLDSTDFMGHYEDYSTAHFALPGMRLSRSHQQDHRAALLGWLGHYPFVKWFSELLHSQGRILFGNGVVGTVDGPHSTFFPHLFDVLGMEGHVKSYYMGDTPRPPNWVDAGALIKRAMMYQKPICSLGKGRRDTYEFNYKHALFYGIHEFAHDVVYIPEELEKVRIVAKKYIPILKELVAGGWSPVTFARSDQVWLERFGGEQSGPLFITIRNWQTSPTDATIEIDLSERGLNGTVPSSAIEMTSGKSVPVTLKDQSAIVTIAVDPEDTKVLKLSLVKNCTDVDGDGYGDPPTNCTHTEPDCRDDDSTMHPGATEQCNGVDDDCDTDVDEDFDLSSDARNCGTCGNSCTQGKVCSQGSCDDVCSQRLGSCDGACVDLQNVDAHCGACGNRCTPGTTCHDGACLAEETDPLSGGCGLSATQRRSAAPLSLDGVLVALTLLLLLGTLRRRSRRGHVGAHLPGV